MYVKLNLQQIQCINAAHGGKIPLSLTFNETHKLKNKLSCRYLLIPI
jgi:hypothetical protein